MTTIDPQTRRRIARTGLTALDKTRACPGYTLYTPIFGSGTVYLLDLHGQEVHRQELPYPSRTDRKNKRHFRATSCVHLFTPQRAVATRRGGWHSQRWLGLGKPDFKRSEVCDAPSLLTARTGVAPPLPAGGGRPRTWSLGLERC